MFFVNVCIKEYLNFFPKHPFSLSPKDSSPVFEENPAAWGLHFVTLEQWWSKLEVPLKALDLVHDSYEGLAVVISSRESV